MSLLLLLSRGGSPVGEGLFVFSYSPTDVPDDFVYPLDASFVYSATRVFTYDED